MFSAIVFNINFMNVGRTLFYVIKLYETIKLQGSLDFSGILVYN